MKRDWLVWVVWGGLLVFHAVQNLGLHHTAAKHLREDDRRIQELEAEVDKLDMLYDVMGRSIRAVEEELDERIQKLEPPPRPPEVPKDPV